MNNQKQQLIIGICMVLFFMGNSVLTLAQDSQKIWHWMEQLGGPGWDIPNGIVTDSKNNVYIAGGFTNQLQGNKKTITSEGNRDIYVARYNDKGKLEWLWQAGGVYLDKIMAIKNAPDNDLYISGVIRGEMKFGKRKIEGDDKKLFVARINKRGKADWVTTIPFYNAASGYLLDTDQSGNILLGGVFADTLHCSGNDLISQGHNDVFLMRLLSDGSVDQVKQIGTKGAEKLTALSLDSLGNVYLTGSYEKTLSIDALELEANGKHLEQNNFILQLDSTLKAVWAKPISSTSYTEVRGMVCNKNNQLYLSGNFNHNLSIDTLNYEAKGLNDFFVCRADTSGNITWIKTFGGKYSDNVSDMKLNHLGGAMITGSFNDTLYLDTLMINTQSVNKDAFIAQLDTAGMVTWTEAIHGEGGSASSGATLDSKGNLYLMGSFNGMIKAGSQELETLGDEDIFVAKYYNCPEVNNAIEAPQYLCQGSSVTLSVANSYSNIIWNDTLKDVNELQVFEPGLYHVNMVDKRGCVVSDTVSITEVMAQEFTLGNDTAMLISDPLELLGPDHAFAYLWNTGSNNQSILASSEDGQPGKYQYELTITDSLGCHWSDDIKIEFYTLPEYADLSEGERLITMFPNPVQESFTWMLETNKEVQITVEILDGGGMVKYHEKLMRYQPGQQMKVEASSLNPGIYYFSVISNDKRITKKFVKE